RDLPVRVCRAARHQGRARDVRTAVLAVQRDHPQQHRVVGARQHVRARAHLPSCAPAGDVDRDQVGRVEEPDLSATVAIGPGCALAGCMTMDVAYILTKGRQTFRALRSHLVADRADDDPHRIIRMHLQVTVEGELPAEAVARALALSYEKYCSVWHSMRQDIV